MFVAKIKNFAKLKGDTMKGDSDKSDCFFTQHFVGSNGFAMK